MIKFQTFIKCIGGDQSLFAAGQIEKDVNLFLNNDNIEILDVNVNIKSEKYESWFACAMEHIIVYIIKYRSKSN